MPIFKNKQGVWVYSKLPDTREEMEVPEQFIPYLERNANSIMYNYTIGLDDNGNLVDKKRNIIWNKDYTYKNQSTGETGTWSSDGKVNKGTLREKETLEAWNKARGGDGTVYKNRSGKYLLKNRYGIFDAQGNGWARDASGKTGEYTIGLLDPTTGSFKDKSYLDSFKTKELGVTPKVTHTASYTAPEGTTNDIWKNRHWSTTAWGGSYGKNNLGKDAVNIRRNLGLSENATAKEAQDALRRLGYNISSDGHWGKQSRDAYENYMIGLNAQNIPQSIDRALAPTSTFPSARISDIGKQSITSMTSPTTLSTNRPRLSSTSIDDIKNLGFRNYSGLVSAANNANNANNGFVQYLFSRYGKDTSKWNQNQVEQENNVSGIYRGSDRNDFLKAANDYINLFNGTPKMQQGGSINMNEQQLQQAFLQYLAQQTGAKSQQELQQIIQKLGEDGLKQAYAQFMQAMQQQVQAAKFGAKLAYINRLNGKCPEGTQLQYYKSGGQLCKKCVQQNQEGGTVQEPTNPIDAFKCGRKMKKRACGGPVKKEACGGAVKKNACGAKMKKEACGGSIKKDSCGAKLKKKCEFGGLISINKCGAKLKKKKCQNGGDLETSKPTKTNKTPFTVHDGKGGKKTTYVKDIATRDSLYANRYNDQEIQTMRPGSYKKGKWTPDRTKAPYNK